MLFPEQCRRATALQRQGKLLREIAAELGVSFEDVALYLFGGIADWQPIGRAKPLNDNQEDDDGQYSDAGPGSVSRRTAGAAAPAALGEPPQHGQGREAGAAQGRAAGDAPGAPPAATAAGLEVKESKNAGFEARADGSDRARHDVADRDAPPADTTARTSAGTVCDAQISIGADAVTGNGSAIAATKSDAAVEPPAEPAKPEVADADPAPVAPPAPAALPDPPQPPAAWVKADGPPAPPMYYPPGLEPTPAPPPSEAPPRKYRLTNGAGEYLRKSGSGMTRNKAEAWSGTAQQMEEAFKVKPTLKDLDPERVV